MFAATGLRTTVRQSPLLFYSMFTLLALALLIPILIPSLEYNFNRTCTQWYPLTKRSFTSASGTNGNGHYNYSTNQSSSYSTSASPFSYKTAVAYQPKDRDDQIYRNLKDSLASPTGEDNYFITSLDNNDEIFAAVADGVGGWAERNLSLIHI